VAAALWAIYGLVPVTIGSFLVAIIEAWYSPAEILSRLATLAPPHAFRTRWPSCAGYVQIPVPDVRPCGNRPRETSRFS
jgi:hypothetical protein